MKPREKVIRKTAQAGTRATVPSCGRVAAGLAGGMALGVYLLTLAPSFVFGDAGEFIAAAVTLGIAHPPGYASYLLAGKLMSYVPFPGELSWRINLFSALCAAAAVALVTQLIRETLDRLYPAIDRRILTGLAVTGGALLAFSRTFWSQAVIAEVYTFHIFLMVSVLFLIERWVATRAERYLHAAALVFGFDLLTHYSALLYLPVVAWRIVGCWRDGRAYTVARPSKSRALLEGESNTTGLRFKSISTLILLAALGFSPAFYLLIRGNTEPVLAWMPIHTVTDWWWHVLRKSGGGLAWYRYATWGVLLKTQLHTLLVDNAVVLWPLAALGAVALRRDDSLRYGSLLGGLVLGGVLSILPLGLLLESNQHIGIPEFTLPYLPFAVLLAAVGLAWIVNKSPTLIPLLVLIPLVPLLANWNWCDRSEDRLARVYGELILEELPENAVVIPLEDSTAHPLYVLLEVERQRPDVTLWYLLPGPPEAMARALDANHYPPGVRGKRIFTDFETSTWQLADRLIPGCPLQELLPQPVPLDTRSPVPLDAIQRKIEPFLPELQNDRPGEAFHWGRRVFGALYVTQGTIAALGGDEAAAEPYYHAALTVDPAQGDALLRLAMLALERKQLDRAENFLNRILTIAPLAPKALVAQGRLLVEQGYDGQAAEAWETARRVDPQNLPSRLYLAALYRDRGDETSARACLREVLRIDPTSTAARDMMK